MAFVTGIAEIVLWVNDLDASLRFYRDLLGFQTISPPNLRNTFLKLADGADGVPQLVVLVPRDVPQTGFDLAQQLHHMAFTVPPTAFDAQREALAAAGYEPRPGTHPVLASRTMYVDDPDGNEVEFICQALAD